MYISVKRFFPDEVWDLWSGYNGRIQRRGWAGRAAAGGSWIKPTMFHFHPCFFFWSLSSAPALSLVLIVFLCQDSESWRRWNESQAAVEDVCWPLYSGLRCADLTVNWRKKSCRCLFTSTLKTAHYYSSDYDAATMLINIWGGCKQTRCFIYYTSQFCASSLFFCSFSVWLEDQFADVRNICNPSQICIIFCDVTLLLCVQFDIMMSCDQCWGMLLFHSNLLHYRGTYGGK